MKTLRTNVVRPKRYKIRYTNTCINYIHDLQHYALQYHLGPIGKFHNATEK